MKHTNPQSFPSPKRRRAVRVPDETDRICVTLLWCWRKPREIAQALLHLTKQLLRSDRRSDGLSWAAMPLQRADLLSA